MDYPQAGWNHYPPVKPYKSMRTTLRFFCVIACLITTQVTVYGQTTTSIDSFPQAEISNGIIRARFYLPDTAKGYYRGSRFDWSGVMPALEFKGHSYSGQWFEHYEPTLHDAIMGPVESFDP